MQGLLLSWVVWLILEVLSLHTAVALLPAASFLPQSPGPIPALTQYYPSPSDSLFTKTSSVSQALSLQCARQSKHVLALVRSLAPFPQAPERDGRLRSVPVLVSLPFLFLFPRKLSPPSAEDDPFLS